MRDTRVRRPINDCLGRNAGFPVLRNINFIVAHYVHRPVYVAPFPVTLRPISQPPPPSPSPSSLPPIHRPAATRRAVRWKFANIRAQRSRLSFRSFGRSNAHARPPSSEQPSLASSSSFCAPGPSLLNCVPLHYKVLAAWRCHGGEPFDT